MNPERWKNIPVHRLLGIPAGYQASSHGRVRSVHRMLTSGRMAGGVVLAQQLDRDGYPTVKLCGRRVRVAVVVQLAFAGPPQVRHLDDDRSNSKPENLAYGSKVENEQDKRRTERKSGSGREFVPPSPSATPLTAELR